MGGDSGDLGFTLPTHLRRLFADQFVMHGCDSIAFRTVTAAVLKKLFIGTDAHVELASWFKDCEAQLLNSECVGVTFKGSCVCYSSAEACDTACFEAASP